MKKTFFGIPISEFTRAQKIMAAFSVLSATYGASSMLYGAYIINRSGVILPSAIICVLLGIFGFMLAYQSSNDVVEKSLYLKITNIEKMIGDPNEN